MRAFGRSYRRGFDGAGCEPHSLSTARDAAVTDTSIMLNRVYCTYFDHNYLPRGLALHHSLQQHAPGARLWVLCLSEACYRTLTALDLPNLVPRRLADFEAADPRSCRDAADAQHDRILFHLLARPGCCTCWKTSRDAEWVTYLDSDLFFFASPDPIYDGDEGRRVRHHPASLHQPPRRPAPVRDLQCRLGERPPLRRGLRRAALVARALHRVVLRSRRGRPFRRPALSRPAARAVSRTFTSSAISAPIWRRGISRICASSGATDRCGSKTAIRCCSSIFTASSGAGATTSTAIGSITRRSPSLMRHRIYQPYIARSLQVGGAGRALSRGGAYRDHSQAFRRRAAGPRGQRAALHARACSIAAST